MLQKGPKLGELQQWLSWVITEPRDAASALAKPGSSAPRRDCHRFIAELPPLSAADRIDLYGFAFYERLIEALTADFETVRARLTEREFRLLAKAYVRKHPSSSYTVSFIGSNLPEFLRRYPLSRRYPYLADLARLDWAELRAFFARDPEVWDSSQMARVAGLTPAQWEKMKFKLGDTVTLLESKWKIDLFRARKKGAVPRGRRLLSVYRSPDFALKTDVLTEVQWKFLRAASRGENLARICSLLPAGAPVGEWMTSWCATGLLRPILR